MAKYLLEEICPRVLDGSGAKAVSVRIWETQDSYAEASIDKNSEHTSVTTAIGSAEY